VLVEKEKKNILPFQAFEKRVVTSQVRVYPKLTPLSLIPLQLLSKTLKLPLG
jgi:hypothetical protein